MPTVEQRVKHNLAQRQRREKLRADPVANAAHLERCRESDRKRYADPVYSAKRLQQQAAKRREKGIPALVRAPIRTKEEWKAKRAAYYQATKGEHQKLVKNWRERNPERSAEIARDSYARRDKSKMRKTTAEWFKRKYDSDAVFRALVYMRHRMRDLVKGIISTATCMKLVGCSLKELRAHLEKQFKPGMTFDNYGLQGWVIDHKMPVSSFKMDDPAQRAKCFHFSNLQPLWADENLKKSDRIIPELMEAMN